MTDPFKNLAHIGQVFANPDPDFTLRCEGSVWLVQPMNEGARAWIRDNVSVEPWQWFGTALAVDQHMLENLVLGIENEGFILERP
jgi:hypothetical protein